MSEQQGIEVRKALVDIDSTLYESDHLFVRAMAEMFGHRVRRRDLDRWDWWERYISIHQFRRLIRTSFHADETIRAMVPFPGVVETLRAWREAGVEICIVSDRHPRTARATRDWLAAWGIEADDVVLRHPIDKIAWARRHHVDLVIDDKPGTIAAALEAGIAAAAIIYPYNRDLLAGRPEAFRGRSWDVLRRRIEARCVLGAGAPAEQAARPASP